MADEFKYDFSGLTTEQQRIICFGGWHVGSMFVPIQPSKGVIKKLLKRGLIVEAKRTITDRYGEYEVIEYRVPLDVHIAYCEQCED